MSRHPMEEFHSALRASHSSAQGLIASSLLLYTGVSSNKQGDDVVAVTMCDDPYNERHVADSAETALRNSARSKSMFVDIFPFRGLSPENE